MFFFLAKYDPFNPAAAGLCIPVVYLILEIVIPKTFMVDDRR